MVLLVAARRLHGAGKPIFYRAQPRHVKPPARLDKTPPDT